MRVRDVGPSRMNLVSLFCGCGGFDLGFAQHGFKSMVGVDIDPAALAVYRQNLRAPALQFDLSGGKLPTVTPRIGIILAGAPCQGFSTVGKRQVDDPRNQLLIAAGHIARQVRPMLFIAENVAAVTAGAHRRYWEGLHEVLRLAGYKTTDFTCEATKMGVAQHRRRRILFAWCLPKEIIFRLPERSGGTLREALTGVEKAPDHSPEFLPKKSDLGKIARRMLPGQKLCNVRGGKRAVPTWRIPEVFGPTSRAEQKVLETIRTLRRQNRPRDWGDADPVPEKVLRAVLQKDFEKLKLLEEKEYVRRIGGSYDLKHTFNGKFRRLKWDEPAHTVDTRFGDPRLFLHPDEDRGFSVREAARIQGFPDDFLFSGSKQVKFKLIGNAVPPPLAECISEFILRAFYH